MKIDSFIDYIIYLLLLFYFAVDCITGVFMSLNLPSISQPFKIIIILFLTFAISNIFSSVFYFYLFSLILLCFTVYCLYDFADEINSLAMLLRIVIAPLLFCYLQKVNEKKRNRLKSIMMLNIVVFFGNLIFGILGFGSATYGVGEGFGVRGFFYDGNALAAILFCMYVFVLNLYPDKAKRISLLFIIFGVIIGTKVAILSTLLYFGVYWILNSRRKFLIFIVFVLISIFAIFLVSHTSIFSYQIERIKYLAKLLNGSYLSAILSGRDRDLIEHWKFFNDNFSLIHLLFGIGFLNFTKIIELDFFDTFISYGLLFFIPIFSFYVHCAYINRKNKNILVFNLLYFMMSITAGHIWFNSSAALFFCIVNIYFKDAIKRGK